MEYFSNYRELCKSMHDFSSMVGITIATATPCYNIFQLHVLDETDRAHRALIVFVQPIDTFYLLAIVMLPYSLICISLF